MPSPWRSLLAFPSLSAVPAAWRQRTGDLFPAFQALCLDKSNSRVTIYTSCPLCGCAHRVIPRHDGSGAVAACDCDPPRCPDIQLTIDDITPLELNQPRLGRALAKALGLVPKFAELPPPCTFQFGAWSADAIPAILTIQYYSPYFRQALAEVAALLSGPFILTVHQVYPRSSS